MMTVVSTSNVPKISFIIGNGVGPVSYIMVIVLYWYISTYVELASCLCVLSVQLNIQSSTLVYFIH